MRYTNALVCVTDGRRRKPMAGKKPYARKYKAGDIVWVRGIVSHEVADWVEVFFNRDTQSLYVEDKADIRRERGAKR